MVEVNPNFLDAETLILAEDRTIMVTPPLHPDYYIARVRLFADQAILTFPKFCTIGCGFAQEEDWNTNLPLSLPAEAIYAHIRHNKKYAEITDEQCIAAIRELQAWWKPRLKEARRVNLHEE